MGIHRLEGKQGSGLTRQQQPPIVRAFGFQKSSSSFFQKKPIRRPRKARVEVPHCRAKVKVRVRTGGENRTAPAMVQRQRMTVRAGGGPFDSGEGIVQRHSPFFTEGLK
jgi:hypothetical protein